MKDSKLSLKRFLREALGLCMVLGYLLRADTLSGDPGVGWHLRAGEWMVKQGTVLRTDPFIFLNAGKSWIHNQWLGDVILFDIWSVGGWLLLDLLVVGIGLFFVAEILPRLNDYWNTSALGNFIGGTISLLLLSMQLFVRPVVFSLMLFAITFFLTQKILVQRVIRSEIILIPLLFLFWANVHPGFAMGFVLLGIATLTSLIEARRSRNYLLFSQLAAIAILSAIATVVNPFGLELHQAILGLLNEPYFMTLNVEWLRPTLWSSFFLIYWFALALFVLLIFSRRGIGLNIFDWLTVLVFGFLSFHSRRYIPFFGIIVAVPLAKLLTLSEVRIGPLFASLLRPQGKVEGREIDVGVLIWIVCVATTIISGTLPGKDQARLGPLNGDVGHALEKIERMGEGRKRIFNHPNVGGLVTLGVYPYAQAYIDDRNELNGVERYKEFFKILNTDAGWRESFRAYNFDFVFVGPTTKLSEALSVDEHWQELYKSKDIVLYASKVTNEE